eukprot:6210895-Pleurochrysis_carterae.AAC.3
MTLKSLASAKLSGLELPHRQTASTILKLDYWSNLGARGGGVGWVDGQDSRGGRKEQKWISKRDATSAIICQRILSRVHRLHKHEVVQLVNAK